MILLLRKCCRAQNWLPCNLLLQDLAILLFQFQLSINRMFRIYYQLPAQRMDQHISAFCLIRTGCRTDISSSGMLPNNGSLSHGCNMALPVNRLLSKIKTIGDTTSHVMICPVAVIASFGYHPHLSSTRYQQLFFSSIYCPKGTIAL